MRRRYVPFRTISAFNLGIPLAMPLSSCCSTKAGGAFDLQKPFGWPSHSVLEWVGHSSLVTLADLQACPDGGMGRCICSSPTGITSLKAGHYKSKPQES